MRQSAVWPETPGEIEVEWSASRDHNALGRKMKVSGGSQVQVCNQDSALTKYLCICWLSVLVHRIPGNWTLLDFQTSAVHDDRALHSSGRCSAANRLVASVP